MNRVPLHFSVALLTVAIAPTHAPAQPAARLHVTLTSSLGGAMGVPGFVPGEIARPATPALLPMPSLTPTLEVHPALTHVVAQAASVNDLSLAHASIIGVPAIASRNKEETPRQRVAPVLAAMELSRSAPSRGGRIFDGNARKASRAIDASADIRRTEDVAAANRDELMRIPGATGVGALDGHGQGGVIMVSFHGESFRRAARRSGRLPARLEGRKVASNVVPDPNRAQKATDVLARHRAQLTRVYGAVRARVGGGGRVIIVEFFSSQAADVARRRAWLPERLGGYEVLTGVARRR